jgi:hypothetical protein
VVTQALGYAAPIVALLKFKDMPEKVAVEFSG